MKKFIVPALAVAVAAGAFVAVNRLRQPKPAA